MKLVFDIFFVSLLGSVASFHYYGNIDERKIDCNSDRLHLCGDRCIRVLDTKNGRTCKKHCPVQAKEGYSVCDEQYDSTGCPLPPALMPSHHKDIACPKTLFDKNGCLKTALTCDPINEIPCPINPDSASAKCPTVAMCYPKYHYKPSPKDKSIIKCNAYCPLPYNVAQCLPTYNEHGCKEKPQRFNPAVPCPESTYDENGCKLTQCNPSTQISCPNTALVKPVEKPPLTPDPTSTSKCQLPPMCLDKNTAHISRVSHKPCPLQCLTTKTDMQVFCPLTYNDQGCPEVQTAVDKGLEDSCPTSQYDVNGCQSYPVTDCGSGNKACHGGFNDRGCKLAPVCIADDQCCPPIPIA